MKVTRLEARDVHGYLPIRVEFLDDLTFLTGLNGSGKTSALRLLMALLTPNIDEFASIAFSSVAATVSDGDHEIVIQAIRNCDGLNLSVSDVDDTLHVTSAELQLLSDARNAPKREESRAPVVEKVAAHRVFQAIASISTPMFLGLDRRFYTTALLTDEINDARRREFVMRRVLHEDPAIRGTMAAGLADVNYLVTMRMHEIRMSQEGLDENLRNRILARAFDYKPSDGMNIDKLPSRPELERYRQRLQDIVRAAEGLHLPVPELTTTLGTFFDSMTKVINVLEKGTKTGSQKRARHEASREFFDWIVNKPQTDRILEHLNLLDKYSTDRATLHAPIERFLSLVNAFLAQTRKRVSVGARGELAVQLNNDDEPRAISALSSGERQILVMLAHLSLNKHLAESGVFIVDEPEISLHIDWQERFVDAIREANPSVQLIMATHSPAIILDRVEHCKSLS